MHQTPSNEGVQTCPNKTKQNFWDKNTKLFGQKSFRAENHTDGRSKTDTF